MNPITITVRDEEFTGEFSDGDGIFFLAFLAPDSTFLSGSGDGDSVLAVMDSIRKEQLAIIEAGGDEFAPSRDRIQERLVDTANLEEDEPEFPDEEGVDEFEDDEDDEQDDELDDNEELDDEEDDEEDDDDEELDDEEDDDDEAIAQLLTNNQWDEFLSQSAGVEKWLWRTNQRVTVNTNYRRIFCQRVCEIFDIEKPYLSYIEFTDSKGRQRVEFKLRLDMGEILSDILIPVLLGFNSMDDKELKTRKKALDRKIGELNLAAQPKREKPKGFARR